MRLETLDELDSRQWTFPIIRVGLNVATLPLDDEPDQFVRRCADCGVVKPVCCELHDVPRCDACCTHEGK